MAALHCAVLWCRCLWLHCAVLSCAVDVHGYTVFYVGVYGCTMPCCLVGVYGLPHCSGDTYTLCNYVRKLVTMGAYLE